MARTPLDREHKQLAKEIDMLNLRIEVAYETYVKLTGGKALPLGEYYQSLTVRPFNDLAPTEFYMLCMFGYAMWLDTLNDSILRDKDASENASNN